MIGCFIVFAVLGVLFVVNTQSPFEAGSKANSQVTMPKKVKKLAQTIPLSEQLDKTYIQISPPFQALTDGAIEDKSLDAEDMEYIAEDTEVPNVGHIIDADQMLYVNDDSPQQNVGDIYDADDVYFVVDSSPQQNVGESLNADNQ